VDLEVLKVGLIVIPVEKIKTETKNASHVVVKKERADQNIHHADQPQVLVRIKVKEKNGVKQNKNEKNPNEHNQRTSNKHSRRSSNYNSFYE
jgi:hypothetical protein